MKGRQPRKSSLSDYYLPLIVVLVAALLIVSFYYFSLDYRPNLRFEGAKYLLQLIIVVVIGGILVKLYSDRRDRAQAEHDRERDRAQAEHDRERDRAQAENEFRKDLLAALTRAYNDTKKVRRILKASTVLKEKGSGYEIPLQVYEQQMQKLMDPQLEFELYKKQLEATRNIFEDTESVRQHLRNLEDYLNKIIKEYESKKGAYKRLKPTYPSNIPTDQLTRLDSFLSGTKFRASFADEFDATAQDIRKEILGFDSNTPRSLEA